MSFIAIAIIGFRNPTDILDCVKAIASSEDLACEVHICENGGSAAHEELIKILVGSGVVTFIGQDSSCTTLEIAGCYIFLHSNDQNLGYAGGLNLIINYLSDKQNWSTFWVLNPDTQPEPQAMSALYKKLMEGQYGIVGARLVFNNGGRIQSYAGRWRRWIARGRNIGFGREIDAPVNTAEVEESADYVSGACMMASRDFVEAVGPLDDRYFLYCEEVDWCLRRGAFKIGYCHAAVVHHSHGTTLGSNTNRKYRSEISVFLDERNRILLTKRFFPKIFPIVVILALFLTVQYVKAGAWRNFGFALKGWFAGICGERGSPTFMRQL